MTSCTHISSTPLKPVAPSSQVYKEECTLCFDSQDLPQGIDVCLSCFNGGCVDNDRKHADLHFRKTQHPLALNIRRVPKKRQLDGTPPPAKISRLAIEEERDEDQWDYITTAKCYACGGKEVDRADSNLASVIESVLQALSAKKQSEVKAWQEEITSCKHTTDLTQETAQKLEGSSLAHCKKCDLKENLWLCLTCGSLGCGRQQFGGIGGNGHGLSHYEETQHPVSVKLGTITPEGSADVFCYQCGEDRLDPRLAQHLETFGINIAGQQKTEKSIGELQLEQNLKFDFSMTTEDGKMLQPLFGAGFTGLRNLGNSCYMASIIQAVFALQPFADRYLQASHEHFARCSEPPAACFHCQMAKMADGLLSGRYSQQKDVVAEDGQTKGQDGITPSMFKSLIGKGHAEFSTMRQQDAQEFFQHLTSIVQQKERSTGNDPSQIFDFSLEQRLQCLECEGVRYRAEKNSSLTLRVPAKKKQVAELAGVEPGDEEKKNQAYEDVSFEECLSTVLSDEVREYKCPHDKADTQATFTTRFKSFPEVLVCTMSRFVMGEGWVMEKLNANIKAPLELDLEAHRGKGQQPDEQLLPEDNSSSASALPSVDQAALSQLVSMGFPEPRCTKALIKTGNNGAEVAMTWLFEHMEDPDIDEPLVRTSNSGGDSSASPQDIQQLMDMGFTDPQARRALKETNSNMERAVDWLFSHADSMDADVDTAGANTNASETAQEQDTRPAKYRLKAFISHKGTSAHCGHYVAHVLRDEKWVLYNDNKVVSVPSEGVEKAIDGAYMYFYTCV
ncbi:hypothetical protein DFS34DRAFT_628945 [Phlyctochytrium arcticum]|nr:hypothetical protein DFS34DRAFT_628945 [Phlyctochytrium arcticum]